MNMSKLYDILGVLTIGLCSWAAAANLLTGDHLFASINIFFAVINGLSVYRKLSQYRQLTQGENSGF